MELPGDLLHFLRSTFAPDDRARAALALEGAQLETGDPPTARLLRCAAFASGGSLERLEHHVAMLAIDWRDVVVAGEYELHNGMPVQVRDLSQPLQA